MKIKNPESFSLKFNVKEDAAHIFIDDEYVNTTFTESGMFVKETIQQQIEGVFLKRIFKNSTYSYKRVFQNRTEDRVEVLEYLVCKGKKSLSQKLIEKFEEDKYFNANYFKSYYSIYQINLDEIRSGCMDTSYKDEGVFNLTMFEQAKALEDFIEKSFGLKIKVTTIPTFRDRNEKSIWFPYKTIKVVDEDKLALKEEHDIDLLERIDEFVAWRRYTNKEEEERENVLKHNPLPYFVNIQEATSKMLRSPRYIHSIKLYEKDLLEDCENYKKRVIGKIRSESTFGFLCIRGLSNFRKLMPEVYFKMFNVLPPALVVTILHKKDITNKELDDVLYNFNLPKPV